MPDYPGATGAQLHYETRGDGPLLVCQPGGPAARPSYLDDLGGVPRTLVLPDPRGVGGSAAATGFTYGELADDLEALRVHLGVDRLDLLGQSAGAWPAMQFAARHPERVAHLVLLCPSRIPIPPQPDEPDREQLAEQLFAAEPWFPAAIAAWNDDDSDPVDFAPMTYAADTPAVRAHATRMENEPANQAARQGFWKSDFDRAALDSLTALVTIIAGDRDIVTGLRAPEILAGWFPNATLRWIAGAGHMPWVVDPVATSEAIEAALTA
jgi:proline iminopeptidase